MQRRGSEHVGVHSGRNGRRVGYMLMCEWVREWRTRQEADDEGMQQ